MTTKTPRVLFYVYPTAFQAPGGGEVQLLQTRAHLEKIGITVKLFDPWQDKLKDYDLIHTFGSVKDCLPVMRAAKDAGIKNVLSTICWYSWKSAWHTHPEFNRRAIAVVRHAVKTVCPFWPSERREMMSLSDLLLPNSESEEKQLRDYFGVSKEKISIIPNGVDESFVEAKPDIFIQKYGFKDFVLSVGRIEPRKNQLGMVRALSGLKMPVIFVGDFVPHYKSYFEQCRKEAGANVHFLGAFPHDSGLLASAYAACSTFVLASWLETPGLAALEAALAGAKIVITQEGATREYFGTFAAYVDPVNVNEIRRKTVEVYESSVNPSQKEYILKKYRWSVTAEKTAQAYQKVLSD